MAEVKDLFPKPLGRPILVTEIFSQVKKIRSYGQSYRIKWLNANRPHPTLQRDHSQKPTRWLIDTNEHRPTVSELSFISSFGDRYTFSGNENNGWNVIGNSVPPMFIRAIALQIRHILWQGPKLEPYSQTMDYKAILDEAWQQHLADREPDAPTVISLFAGGGGSSLGYSMAGYRELLAVEWDNNAVETFKLNFPDVPVYHGDIANLSVEECMKLAGLTEPGQLDLLDGSPPCQGFSSAGKRILDDPRNQLFREYIRLLRGLKPKVFLMENVSGLVKGKMKLVFAEIMRELKASGYQVKCQLMNTMYYYVPQSRQRLIFIGVRNDLEIGPSFPKPESRPITVREAFNEVNIGEVISPSPSLAKCIPTMKPGRGGVNGLNQQKFNTKKLHWDKPANNIAKEHTGSWAGLVHPSEDRLLGLGELQRLQSFPDRFNFQGGYKAVVPIIGNSVPPLFMRSIARYIRQEIICNWTPHEQLDTP